MTIRILGAGLSSSASLSKGGVNVQPIRQGVGQGVVGTQPHADDHRLGQKAEFGSPLLMGPRPGYDGGLSLLVSLEANHLHASTLQLHLLVVDQISELLFVRHLHREQLEENRHCIDGEQPCLRSMAAVAD
jgi:hypothetical protein